MKAYPFLLAFVVTFLVAGWSLNRVAIQTESEFLNQLASMLLFAPLTMAVIVMRSISFQVGLMGVALVGAVFAFLAWNWILLPDDASTAIWWLNLRHWLGFAGALYLVLALITKWTVRDLLMMTLAVGLVSYALFGTITFETRTRSIESSSANYIPTSSGSAGGGPSGSIANRLVSRLMVVNGVLGGIVVGLLWTVLNFLIERYRSWVFLVIPFLIVLATIFRILNPWIIDRLYAHLTASDTQISLLEGKRSPGTGGGPRATTRPHRLLLPNESTYKQNEARFFNGSMWVRTRLPRFPERLVEATLQVAILLANLVLVNVIRHTTKVPSKPPLPKDPWNEESSEKQTSNSPSWLSEPPR